MGLITKQFVFNPFAENTCILHDETRDCIIIDPGCYEKSEIDELIGYVQTQSLNVKMLLNTHCHIDHVLGNYAVRKKYDVPLIINKLEEPGLRAVRAYAPNYGFTQYQEVLPDRYIDESDEIVFGNHTLRVLFVPGHSVGHLAFFDDTERILIGGDVLFRDSIGRTDLPGGDHDTLLRSIHRKLFTLHDDVVVWPGHGPDTTIGYEKRSNPFCALKAPL